MASNAMILSSDSLNPAVAEMPLYAVLVDGQFAIIDPRDIEDLPRYRLTPAGREELLDNYHTHEWLNDALKRNGIDMSWLDEIEVRDEQ